MVQSCSQSCSVAPSLNQHPLSGGCVQVVDLIHRNAVALHHQLGDRIIQELIKIWFAMYARTRALPVFRIHSHGFRL